MRRAALVLAVSALGCEMARVPTVPSTGTPQEERVVSETARFAAILAVKASGKLTDHRYVVPAGYWSCPPDAPGGCLASGWWDPPVAYYYRPHVIEWSLALVTDVAAHETCHAIERGHNAPHLACIAKVGARPTYAVSAAGVSVPFATIGCGVI